MAALTEEQGMLRDQAKAWVTEQAPVLAFRRMRDSGVDTCFSPDTWRGIVDMGWTGILVPETHGGADMGYLTMGLLLEETGRQLTASPLIASALVGATALRLAGSDAQQAAWLPRIVDGSAIFTLAVDEGPKHAPERIACAATASAGGFRLDGTKTYVLEGMAATHFVVPARTAGGVTLFLVAADAPGLTRSRVRTSDCRGYATVSLAGVTVAADAVLGGVDRGAPLLDAILDRARAGIAAEMLGTASAAFDMTLSYLQTRVQFGQVIGSFQTLGHRAAELFTEMELTRSCVEGALQAIDAGAADVAQLCSLAKCRAGTFLFNMSNQLIQIHGGIGMTDEFDAGFYLKRARAIEAVYGNQAYHRNRYATLLGF